MEPSITVASPSTEQNARQPITTPQIMLCCLPLEDDVFIMDEIDTTHFKLPGADVGLLSPAASSATAVPIPVPVPAWKASGSTRSVDLLLIIPLRISVVNFSISFQRGHEGRHDRSRHPE